MSALPITLPKRVVVVLLGSVYVAAFILSSYWNGPQSLPVKYGILTALIAVGAAWAYLSAGQLQLRVSRSSLVYGGLLLAGLFLLNYRALTSVIPWRGDEAGHIFRT